MAFCRAMQIKVHTKAISLRYYAICGMPKKVLSG